MEGFGKLTTEVSNTCIDDTYAGSHDDVAPTQVVCRSRTPEAVCRQN